MKQKLVIVLGLLLNTLIFGQVGINTETPDPSAVLDIQFRTDAGFTPKGMLTPRMTTVQRNSIASPANGLLVYDTDLKTFVYNSGTKTAAVWTPITSAVATGRTNFKRIKSTDVLSTVLAAELAASGTSNKYLLNTNTLYEINGTITLDKPIDLNNAYIQGIDSGDDKLVSAGNIFDGATGGTVKGLTLTSTGGKVFNLSATAAQNLIWRDCIVAGSANVGTINNMGLVFLSTVQFSDNTTGITYSNISQLLLSNMGWFGNNRGTFEKLTGTFGLVQKQGGFSEVNGTAVGFDVSENPSVGNGVLTGVVYTGTNTSNYVNPYPPANRYVGYNFNNSWSVDSPGIPKETDAEASATFTLNYSPVGTGISINPTSPPTLINAVSEGNNLFRFSTNNLSRLTYLGKKKRIVSISGSMSFQAPGVAIYIVYLANKGVISQNKFFGRSNNTNDIVVIPIDGTLELSAGDYVEVYIERFSGATGNVIIPNMSLSIK